MMLFLMRGPSRPFLYPDPLDLSYGDGVRPSRPFLSPFPDDDARGDLSYSLPLSTFPIPFPAPDDVVLAGRPRPLSRPILPLDLCSPPVSLCAPPLDLSYTLTLSSRGVIPGGGSFPMGRPFLSPFLLGDSLRESERGCCF